MASTDDTTTMSRFDEHDNDPLLLLTGLERLEYFSEKPTLKSKNLRDHIMQFCKKLCV